MKVYIVQGNDYEDNGVRSVWSTEEAAYADMKRRLETMIGNDYLIVKEYEVDPKDTD